ncbi:ABC transporter ATP-binding protein [Bifidobacterium dentium]|uniref:Amino acid ABC transporter ATP-binding protein n=1 Tax=Bifidobacterium goeldii TaxID=2306975 RepID=A0A430FIM4_9BIFI|nr:MULTISPECIES: ABC transporter ATP-binding protein [Bifidobacterium]NEG42754.1 ABC transporter ATP-binding protein [Bifidobacterium dentium]NEG53627.1 ABC transporter ATP-binding protein [Bifidobacterium dentium]RSX52745.1 amino acid ABC transporter ATP-binding protein [Bifidobacterium goeldii]
MNTKLVADHLSKTYGSRTILHGLSFSVEEGTSMAITGPSGSGKSTLLNIIGLLDAPTGGAIMLDGQPLPGIDSRNATMLRRNKINYLFQSYALINDMSALDNVTLGMRFTRDSNQVRQRKAKAMLARLGLGHVTGDKIMTLSGGEQQRVALARCILKPGDLILADEPTGALDHDLAQHVFDEMLRLQHEYGKTLIVVTHDPGIAAQCDHAIELQVV